MCICVYVYICVCVCSNDRILSNILLCNAVCDFSLFWLTWGMEKVTLLFWPWKSRINFNYSRFSWPKSMNTLWVLQRLRDCTSSSVCAYWQNAYMQLTLRRLHAKDKMKPRIYGRVSLENLCKGRRRRQRNFMDVLFNRWKLKIKSPINIEESIHEVSLLASRFF